MNKGAKQRLAWVKMYQETSDAGLVCRRCGISRPTLRKWLKRYEESGEAGLEDQSKRPLSSPNRKVFEAERTLVLELRIKRKFGARRIQNELQRHHNLSLSLETIHKILTSAAVPPLVRPPRRKGLKRYAKDIPGERVQMDTCKIAPGCYQYTAVDDCTRYRVLAVFERRTASNTLLFMEQLIDEMPFPVQRIQTDRGREFFAISVQRWLMEACIKFRPVKPRSPHLNGKVERSQKTDLEEFWANTDPKDPDLERLLAEWQHYYNWDRPHGSLGGKTPIDVFFERMNKAPFWDEVEYRYSLGKERIQEADYALDLRIRRSILESETSPEK